MAVTVLKHLKESKTKNKAQHLKNSIHYICNPKKTDDGSLVFSNCGTSANEIYESMVETKKHYQKEWGRQGYHYVISLPPGEGTEELMYDIAKEFCESLLSDFDYVFAVHNDQHHLHAHLVFNSVNRMDGYKYRYNNGDWAKIIQPVTDRLCEKHGLSTLEYAEDAPRTGKNYAEHMAEKEGRLTHSDLIRMDIDAAVLQSISEQDFFAAMKEMGYNCRTGHSKAHGEYVAYTMPGAKKAKRDYTLGEGYTLADVRSRIRKLKDEWRLADENLFSDDLSVRDKDVFQNDTGSRRVSSVYHKLDPYTRNWFPEDKLQVYRMSALKGSRYQVCMVRRVEQAIRHYDFELILSEQERVRNDLIHMDRLREECEYLMDRDFSSLSDLENRLAEVKNEIKAAGHEVSDEKIALQAERRILRRLIKEYDSTLAVRDLTAREQKGKELTNDRQEEKRIDKGAAADDIKADSPVPSGI